MHVFVVWKKESWIVNGFKNFDKVLNYQISDGNIFEF